MRCTVHVIKPMNRSTDSLTGSPTFSLETKKQADGTYEATCRSLPDMKGEVAATETDAIRQLQRKLEAWVLKGGR